MTLLTVLPRFRTNNPKGLGATLTENINAVPIEYLNRALAAGKESWRVRIVDGDEYEFYVPGN
jgi:hypothetical protein